MTRTVIIVYPSKAIPKEALEKIKESPYIWSRINKVLEFLKGTYIKRPYIYRSYDGVLDSSILHNIIADMKRSLHRKIIKYNEWVSKRLEERPEEANMICHATVERQRFEFKCYTTFDPDDISHVVFIVPNEEKDPPEDGMSNNVDISLILAGLAIIAIPAVSLLRKRFA